MKEPEHDAQKIKSSILKKKLKALIVSIDESDVIRLHRAISWVKCAEDQENNTDLKSQLRFYFANFLGKANTW